jgi:hypothetical protein
MIELVSIIASLVVCILIPIEVGRIRRGWVRKQFAGDRGKFIAAYRKQLKLLLWLGLVFGVLEVVLASIETHTGERPIKLIAAVIWFAVFIISLIALRMLAKVPEADPARSPGA